MNMGKTVNVATSAGRMRRLRAKRKEEMSQDKTLLFKKIEAVRQRELIRAKKKEKLAKDPT